MLLPTTEDMELFKDRSAEAYQRRDLYKRLKCREYYLTPNNAENAPEECNQLQFSISSVLYDGGLRYCRVPENVPDPYGTTDPLTI